MGSVLLPLELQQHVFSLLDAESFHAARHVCRWWRHASVDAVTLAKQLKTWPIQPPASAVNTGLQELHNLFNEAAYTLMLGLRITRQPDRPGKVQVTEPTGFLAAPRVTASSCDDRVVTLTGRTIAVFDLSANGPRVLAQRLLNDLNETIGGGPWLKPSPTTYFEMALSSNGTMLAVGQECTIQIYDLTAEPDSFTVNEYVHATPGNYICGLEFEQNDHVLRVQLSDHGVTVYLGSPPVARTSPAPKATIEHWKSKGGLRHVFLDSSQLASASNMATEAPGARICGLQLLQPLRGGYVFAAQKHGGVDSSVYILGHVQCAVSNQGRTLTAEPRSVSILAKLSSFLSAWHHAPDGVGDGGCGLWENMPSVQEHHPSFALSPTRNILVLAERDKKRLWPEPLTHLFLYRVPSKARLLEMLERGEMDSARRRPQTNVVATPEKGVESSPVDGRVEVRTDHTECPTRSISRMPICLSSIPGALTELEFEPIESEGKQTLVLRAATHEVVRRWALTENL